MKTLLLTLAFSFHAFLCFSQSVVVSSYFNAGDPRDEWTELLVVTDNTDMRNWTIRDNNSGQTAWQTAAIFTNNALWNNLRAGTIIMIWHRPVTSNGSTLHPTDVNKDDGYIELDLSNATYFSGAALGSSPTWGGASMNIAGGGDVIQLRTASGTHVHALGHISSPGTDWTALPFPKLNHANSASSGDAIYVSPGNVVADFGTNTPQNATTWTAKNSGTITFGLPNISGSGPTQNTAFWDTLREPVLASQSVPPTSVIAGTPGSISFSWSAAVDPNAADGTTGYLILRNTTNTFTAPADGTTYTNGSTLGSATVLTHITASGTTTYTDNTVMNGNAYYYRVYAYRYTTDNTNGNTFHRARGRAYTSTFVSIQQTNPLPVEMVSFTGQAVENTVQLYWETASELNNDYFSVERSNGNCFEAIGRVAGHGTCSQPYHYQFTDAAPENGVNYYRLRQVDLNGDFEYSAILAITVTGETEFSTGCFLYAGTLTCSVAGETPVTVAVFDLNGKMVAEKTAAGIFTIAADQWPAGVYLVRFSDGKNTVQQKVLH